jgi:hypothetical protein
VNRAVATLFFAAFFACGAPASADDKDACMAAHEHAQSLRNDGHLRAARAELLVCARDVCPQLITADCRPWLSAANDEQPSVVLAVRDESGVETSDVRVSVDGTLLASRLDGRPIDIDPGDHVLRFERAGQPAIEQRVFVRVREKERVVQVSFAGAKSPTPGAPTSVPPPLEPHEQASSGSRWSAGVIVSGIVGILGVGAFAVAGIAGKVDESDLASSGCKPNCPGSKIDPIRTHYEVAYASLGVGVVGLGLATGLWLAHPRAESSSGIDHVRITPTAGGMTAGLSGHF